MRIRVETALAAIGQALTGRLVADGHDVTVELGATRAFELAYVRTTPIDEVTALLTRLKPLSPAIMPVATLRDADAVIRVGHDKPLSKWNLTVHADDGEFGERLKTRLTDLGFSVSNVEVDEVEDERLRYGGASPLARQLLRWTLAELALPEVEEENAWSDGDDDIWVYARDPALLGKPLQQRCAVVLASDDLSAALALQAKLAADGFTRVQLRPLEGGSRPLFCFKPGPLSKDTKVTRAAHRIIEAFLRERGADPSRHPLRVDTEAEDTDGAALVTLPLALLDSGRLRPWAGRDHDRWDVLLMTDSPTAGMHLSAAMHEAGVDNFRVQHETDSLIDAVVRYPAAARATAEQVRDFLLSCDLDLTDVQLDPTLPDEGHVVIVELPLDPDTTREERLRVATGKWDITLKCPNLSLIADLEHDLRALPWDDFSVETDESERGRIQYGGAPRAVVELVRGLVEKSTGHKLKLEKSWGDDDDDIWVSVPMPTTSHGVEDLGSNAELDLDAWLQELGDTDSSDGILNSHEPISTPMRDLVDVQRETLRVGPISLGRRVGLTDEERALVPLARHFEHYCLDTTTAASLVHVAESVLLREPCLLEGETSVSKTSVVLYLAMLLGQPVVRLNLNGQTDTGELVGRFVPRDELPKEGEPAHPWRWQDGLVVTAMKRGWWVVLDELNLAEPQILERLNPALERIPSLVLTEHRGEVIGAGGTPVAPTFRMFATMNPAEYAGRSALSPAYRDRWRGYRYVRAPGEVEYLAMLRFLVHGEHPAVRVLGERFAGDVVSPPLGALAAITGLDNFLRALARFHAGLEGAARSRTGSLGARRKDRYVFTRRGLLAVMDYLAMRGGEDGEILTLRKALVRYYLARVRPGSDRVTVARLMDAAGIGPGLWAPERVDAAPATRASSLDDQDPNDEDEDDGEDDGEDAQ